MKKILICMTSSFLFFLFFIIIVWARSVLISFRWFLASCFFIHTVYFGVVLMAVYMAMVQFSFENYFIFCFCL